MTRDILAPTAVALLVLLAGCAGGIGSLDGTTTSVDGGPTAVSASGAAVDFYISDERNDIDDFEHLNVTVTKVGFKTAEADDADGDDETDTTAATSNGTSANATSTMTANATSTATTVADDEDEEADGEMDGDGEWVTYDIEDRTVDLTELQGADASKVGNMTVENGTYTKVFVYVSEVNGTLADGSSTTVKLPSGRLHLNERFTVGDGDDVDFVFDITVVKAGNSGKYILKPIASESGTDVPLDDVGDRDDDEREDRDDDEREDREEREGTLNVSLDAEATPGENVTVSVTDAGDPVANATVTVNGETAGTTAADGTLVVTVPDADEVEVVVEVVATDAEGELEIELDGDEDGGQSD